MKFLPVFSEDLATLVFFIVFAYLLGSIPFGIIWAKVFKLGSLKDIGSGNIGATNADKENADIQSIEHRLRELEARMKRT